MPVFDYEWIEADPYPDPVAHRTMAKLTIRLADQVATSVHDRYLREDRDHVFVPLSQVAEWLVMNWWHLWYESGNASGNQPPGFDARHDLSAAGFGFALPRLTLRPVGSHVVADVLPSNPPDSALEFRARCRIPLHRDRLEAEAGSLVESVVERLRHSQTPFAALESDWNAIVGAPPDQREFCQVAATAGLDPFEISDDAAQAIVRFWNDAAPSLRDDAIREAEPARLGALHDWLQRQTESLGAVESGEGWRDIRRSVGGGNGAAPPWRRGYTLAQAVRSELEPPSGRLVLEQEGPLRIGYREAQPPSAGIEGVVASHSPSCVLSPRRKTGRTFLLARALGDYLGRSESGPGLLGTAESARQAQSRAFAAEFLAPAKWLRTQVGNARLVDAQTVDELAYVVGVSPWVIYHQLRNHGIADIVDPIWPVTQ